MINELWKRPFSRPLVVWIVGIILQTVFHFQKISVVLLFIPCILLGVSVCTSSKTPAFHSRWVWGIVFSSLLLVLSVQFTAWQQKKKSTPVLSESVYEYHVTAVRDHLLTKIDKLELNDQEKSVLAAITLGYRKNMDRELRQKFSATGVAHILAVSGFHVGVIAGFISLLFGLFPSGKVWKYLKYIFTLILIWLYALLTGLAPSTIRAAVMLSFYLTGRYLGKNTDSYNTLFAAGFCMLVYNPLFLYDIGFQLSFTAVFFILCLQPRFKRLIQVRNPLLSIPWDWITVTLSAQIGVTFLCLYYFGQFSTVFLLTNLPFTLLATLLLPLSVVWFLLPEGFPGFAEVSSMVEWFIQSMVWIVNQFNIVPGSILNFHFDGFWLLTGYFSFICLLLYLQYKYPKYLFFGLTGILVSLLKELTEKFF